MKSLKTTNEISRNRVTHIIEMNVAPFWPFVNGDSTSLDYSSATSNACCQLAPLWGPRYCLWRPHSWRCYWRYRQPLLGPSLDQQVKMEIICSSEPCHKILPLQWRHNKLDGVSDHQPHDCLFSRLFRRRSKKTSKLRVTGRCARNSPVTGKFHAQMVSNAENVSIWWRHHV